MNQSYNTEYKEKKPFLTTLMTSSIMGLALSSGYISADNSPNQPINSIEMIEQSYNYHTTKQSTYINSTINNRITIEEDIIKKIDSEFGYKVLEVNKSSLIEEEDTFSIYTMLLDLEIRDYSKLLDEEWELSELLDLYEKNIILRFV